MNFRDIKETAEKLGFTGHVSERVPNPYVRVAWYPPMDDDVKWFAKTYEDYADIVCVEDNRCYHVRKK